MAKAAKSSPETQEIKKTPLQLEMEKIEKDYGKGSMLNCNKGDYDIISTGSLGLDIALGIGGLARGKVVEFQGWSSSGKSTITLYIIAEAQKLGVNCLLIDGEQSFDSKYAQTLGVDVDKLIKFQVDEGGGERAYDVAERLIKTKQVGVVVIDSQTALLPKKMFDDPNDASNLGLHARLMSRVIPKFTMLAASHNTLIIVISQFREKIGVMWGDPTTTNGGHALEFYSHVRLKFSKSVLSDDEKNPIANKTTVKVIKNKLSSPFKTATFNIVFGEGIDKLAELFDVACDMNIITKAGSWYSYKGTQLGQGEDKVIQLLRDNESYAAALKKRVLEKLNEDETNSGTNVSDVGQEGGGILDEVSTNGISEVHQTTSPNRGDMESSIFNSNTNTSSDNSSNAEDNKRSSSSNIQITA